MADLEIASLFLSLPDDIFVSSVRATTTELVVRITCQRSCAACPVCQQTSERVHGNYGRTVADLPCAGRRVILALTIRKFVYRTPTCPRQIFTERLPDLVQSYARMTNRLRQALVAARFGHQRPGERATGTITGDARFGSHASSSSAGRRMPAPKVGTHSKALDDWAWKKGQTYATSLVDLEKRCPIELLADRKEETLTAWLLTHPEIDVISRDRGGEYAAAARKGAPQARAYCRQIPPGEKPA